VLLAGALVGLLYAVAGGPKSVHSGNGLPLLALRHLVSLPVSTPLRIAGHVHVSGAI